MRKFAFCFMALVGLVSLALVFTACSSSSSSSSKKTNDTVEPATVLLVANSNDNTVSFLDPATGATLGPDVTTTGSFPWEITMSEDGATAYVSCRGNRDGDGQVSMTEAYIWVAKHRYTEGSMFDDNGDGVGGQWTEDTFDPHDPNEDGYNGNHYSLRGWKPVRNTAGKSDSGKL